MTKLSGWLRHFAQHTLSLGIVIRHTLLLLGTTYLLLGIIH